MTRPLLTLLALGFCAIFSSNQLTADIAFVLDDSAPAFTDGINNGDIISAGGIDLEFSNVVISDGSTHGDVEGVGILISGVIDPGFKDVISFDFSFSESVQLLTYDIGAHEDVPAARFFTISGVNGTSGNNLIPEGNSASETKLNFVPGTITEFQAGEVYSFSHNLPGNVDATFNLEEFSVRAIPEPGFGIAGLVLICLSSLRRRRN